MRLSWQSEGCRRRTADAPDVEAAACRIRTKIRPAHIGLTITERLDRLYDYCRQDVEVERELYERLPPLSPAEQALWVLSNQINERGFRVDRDFAEAARKIAQAAAPEIDPELAEITGGAVTSINQIARLLHGCSEQGCPLQEARSEGDREQLLDQMICRRLCGGRWSCGSAEHRRPLRRSTPCSPVPAMTIVCAAPSAITAPLPAAGR